MRTGFLPDRQTAVRFQGFTIVELLVVISVIAILAGRLLPVIGRSKQKGYGAACINNIRQLQLAWTMYIDEHDQQLPPNSDQPLSGRDLANPSWVAGWLRSDEDPGSKYDSTNVDLLIGEAFRPFGSIGGYSSNPRIYRCPSDRSSVTIDGMRHDRVRTYSMNCYMNGNGIWQLSNYVTFRKVAEISDSSKMWVLIDEWQRSINDGYFAVDLSHQYNILDIPADYHNGASVLSFADGHAESHLWLEATTRPGFARPFPGAPMFTSANDRDMAWLSEHTTVLK